MLINADISTNKHEILVKKYAELLNSGMDSNEILVLVLNSHLKQQFINETLSLLKINSFEKLQVHSFFSLVYNTISDNWALIEQSNPFNNPTVLPNLAGLEISQFLLKDILKEIQFKGYNSKKSLLHQIFRRYSLIVQNDLSDTEVDERSKVLKESFASDIKLTLKKFLSKTLFLRDFDYLRQTLVFNYIYKNTDYFKNIKYLILDDGDEITPVCFDFIKYLAPQLKDVFIAYDKLGGSRTGYLSADKTAIWEFEKVFNQTASVIEENPKQNAQEIFSNVISNKKDILTNFYSVSPSKRAVMIDLAIKQMNELLSHNVLPSEISIVTPVIDDMLKFTLKEGLKKNANLTFLSGSEKLIQNKLVLSILTILKLDTKLKSNLSEFDIRPILNDFLGIPIKYCKDILVEFDKTKTFVNCEFPLPEYSEKYTKFLQVLDKIKSNDAKLSEQVLEIFNTLSEFTSANPQELIKFNFFIKQLQEFENVLGEDFYERKEDILNDIENSIIAENPYNTIEIKNNDLVIGTPQKIIDNQIKVKYEFWLDTSSSEWIKSDTGPLYNAWVFQKGWEKDEFTIEDNIELSKEKTAKILRKLTLLSEKNVYCYSSLFDGNGVENFGGIDEYILTKSDEKEEVKTEVKRIVPREDQKPVLDYEQGQMAISAVPGAGKTTILLALILKLLDNGINPENIFVMTYMESAARNFRERIKNIRTDSSQLPNISTIHGLALRILKENGNFERLNLSPDFDICDDTQKARILKETATEFKLKSKEIDEFERGISVFKISEGSFPPVIHDKKIFEFKKFFEKYQSVLKENNLIDYDDMLISSVKLLKENPDILEYYQNICHYIIEDEAQDSSSVQQELISLLSGKYKNLIRCGDINQAITTTFSNADVEGFRKFIHTSNDVKMDCSQRCSKEVYELANELVKWAKTKPEYNNAFYDIYMKPVKDKNPNIENAVHSDIFKTPQEEKNNVLKAIKKALKQNKSSTIGILLRSNYQVGTWQIFINNSGLKCITRSECLEQKTVFRTIFAILKLIQSPFDNENVADNYEILSECGLYTPRLAADIRKYENPFVQLNADNIENTSLAQFYWDLNYWISFPYLSVAELVIKIGLHYFSNDIEKSNVYLISTLVKRLSTGNNDYSYIIEQLSLLSKRTNLSGFKFFSEDDESDISFLEGKVQIMTMHKSKGDEFDYVFIPEMSERNYTLDMEELKLKNSDFLENLRRLNPTYKEKTVSDIKISQIEETLRLLYVGITRAKKQLYISTSQKVKSFNKIKEEKPNTLFKNILTERTVTHG
ncbi:MAG: ATP-dependent helicase [Clostridiaceae bacterium]|nr:ATP-dependent helicase [Clostridiaceae bacterium]